MAEGLDDMEQGVWQQFLDDLPYPVFVKDAEGRYLGCNMAFADHLGIPPSRILGLTVFDLAPPDLATVYRKADEELLDQGGVQVYDAKVRYADGTIRDIRFRKSRLEGPGGRPIGIAGIMEDVTERRRLESELADRHAEMASALMATGDLVFLLDPDLRFLPLPYPRPEEEGSYFAAPVEFLGRRILEVLPADLSAGIEAHVRRAFAGDQPVEFSYEVTLRGERRVFEARVVRMLVEQNRAARCLVVARDVTKRRAAEDGLRIHARVLAAMPIGYLLCRLEDPARPETLAIRALNAAAERIFGMPSAHLVGRRSAEAFPALMTSGALEQFARVIRTGKGMVLPEFPYEDDRLPMRTYTVRLEPMGDRQLVFLFEDITERKEVEARERERHDLYLELAESNPDAVYRVSMEGEVLYISRAVERILGYDPVEMIGKPFINHLEPTEIPRAMAAFLEVVRGEPSRRLTVMARRKDGARVHLEVWSVPIMKEGRIVALQGALRDVTEQETTSEKLRALKRDLEDAERIAGLHAWSWEVASNRMTWSRGIYEITGLPEDVVITEETLLATVHPDDRDRLRSAAYGLLEGKAPPQIDYRVVRPDGSIRHLVSSARVVYAADGTPERMAGVVQDFTDRVRASDAAKESERLASVGRLAGTVAHEINNPLAAIAMRVEMLEQDLADRPDAVAHLAVVKEQCDRIRLSIQQLIQRTSRGEDVQPPSS